MGLGAAGTVCRALRALQTSWVRGVVAPLPGERIFKNGSWILEACTHPFRASETLKSYPPWDYPPFSKAPGVTKEGVALRGDSPHAAQGPLGPCRAQGPCIQAGCVVSWLPWGNPFSEMGPGFRGHVPIHFEHVFLTFREACPPLGPSPL